MLGRSASQEGSDCCIGVNLNLNQRKTHAEFGHHASCGSLKFLSRALWSSLLSLQQALDSDCVFADEQRGKKVAVSQESNSLL